jgi:nucleotide-binding universal stress UspA family protein
MHAVDRILAATDRSQTAERAVEWAADMARRYDAELVLLRVVAADVSAPDDLAAELEQHARSFGLPRARALVVAHADPSAAIVEAAEAERADVLVVGSVGMSGRREFLLGNVPNRVSHNAPCTVVIVDTRGDSSRRLLGRRR